MNKEYTALRDDDFDESVVPTQWHYFEALDRCHMITVHISSALYNHPGLTLEEAELAQLAVDNIMEIYQRLGRRTL